MTRLRSLPLFLATASVLLAACGSGDVLDGNGTSASGSSSGGFPSSASSPDPSASTGPSTSAPTSGGSSSAGGDRVVTLTSLTGTATTVALDAGFVRALSALKITPGLVGTARLSGSAFVLPVTGGKVTVFAPGAPQLATASVEHAGSGLTLVAGGTTISITDIRVDLGEAAQLNGTLSANGKVVVRSATMFDVNSEAIRATGSPGAATVTGVGLRMDSGLSELLNTSFVTQAFTPGLLLGTATLTLVGS